MSPPGVTSSWNVGRTRRWPSTPATPRFGCPSRVRGIDDFASITEERALALARSYDLDYLIVDRPFSLPLVYENRQFRVYSLGVP